MQRNLLLLAASLLFALALAEGILRLFSPTALLAKLPNRPNQNVVIATNEFSSRVMTNARGLRETRNVRVHHPGVFRIAAVGDSFTWGWGVDNAASYPAQLEALLKQRLGRAIEVINVARPGDDLAGYISLLHHHALPLRPDAVIVGFLPGNDCPLEWPPRIVPEDQVAGRIAEHVHRALDTAPKGFHLGRLFTVSVGQPLREWMRARRAPSGGSAIAGDNPLTPKLLARQIGGDPAKAERVAWLEREGWIEKGRRWAVSPWLIVSAIEAPDFPRVGLFLDEGSRAAMASQWRVCEGLIERMRADVEAVGARFALLVFPSSMQAEPRAIEHRRALGFAIDERALGASEPNRRLAAFCTRTGTLCVDTLEAARAAVARGKQLFYPLDGHMTREGYALVAERVAEAFAPLLAAR